MPSFKSPCTNMTRHLSSPFFDALDHIGSGQTEHTPPQLEEDVQDTVLEAIHLCLLLGLFIDQASIPVHFCH